VLLLGLGIGLAYLFAAPPWQHYDEPGHFEFAWLIANQDGLPQKGEYNQAMRRELAASMVEHNFFGAGKNHPNLLSKEEPVWIGISQISNYSVYHTLLSLPLRIFRASDITFQLYLARLVSLLLYLLTLAAAYGIACELSPPEHPLRWMLPISLALLAGFTDLMTGLNDDVGATAFFSLFIWASIALIRRGFSWLRFFAVLITATLCFFTKVTVNTAIILMVIPVLFSIFRGRWRWLAWAAIVVGLLAGLPLVFAWGDAAVWYRGYSQDASTRVSVENAPYGKHAVQLVAPPGTSTNVYQLLPEDAVKRIEGRTATLGAWMWASQRVTASAPVFFDGSQTSSQVFDIGKEPQFVSIQVQLPDHLDRGQVILSFSNEAYNIPVSVYFDGIVLSPGKRPVDEPPEFSSARLDHGEWGGRNFNNLIRNSSGEASWPWIRPYAERFIGKYITGAPSLILGALLDWPGGNWYYRTTIKNLFQTFWAVFGWGHVRLQPTWIYYLFAVVTAAGLIGAAAGLVRRRFRIPWEIVVFLAIAFTWMWAAAFVRGFGSLVGSLFIPSARYAYPAIIPTVLLLCIGWLELIHPLGRLSMPANVRFLPYWVFFLFLNLFSLATIYRYYH
jgi:hypothetical protein